jgi:hypothetical protein
MNKEYDNTTAQLSSISWQLKQLVEQMERFNDNYEKVNQLKPEQPQQPAKQSKPDSTRLREFLDGLGK